MSLHLSHDLAAVDLDRDVADVEMICDLFVPQPGCDMELHGMVRLRYGS